MKTIQHITMVLVLALAVVGCSKKSSGGGESPVVPDVVEPIPVPEPPPGGDDGGNGTGSNTVDFVPVSINEMNKYVATHPLNAPSNIKITVDLESDNEYRFAGAVRLSYDDAGQHYEGVFTSGTGKNSNLPYSGNNGMKEYGYNVWFKNQGKLAFSGYFQDPYGAVVLVIDKVIDQGDGQGTSQVSGSLWYRNFENVLAPQGPERKCWYINLGPYMCGSNAVYTKKSIYPNDTYRKLGTFKGLTKSKAFR